MTLYRKDVEGWGINLFCQLRTKCVGCSDLTEIFKKDIHNTGKSKVGCPIIKAILEILPYRLSQIIKMRFGFYPYKHKHTTKEIATFLNISRERMRQLEGKTLRLLSTGDRGGYLAYLKKKNSLFTNAVMCPPTVDRDSLITDLFDSIRVINCLHRADIYTLNTLIRTNYSELLKIEALGKKSLYVIREKMEELGITLNNTFITGENHENN